LKKAKVKMLKQSLKDKRGTPGKILPQDYLEGGGRFGAKVQENPGEPSPPAKTAALPDGKTTQSRKGPHRRGKPQRRAPSRPRTKRKNTVKNGGEIETNRKIPVSLSSKKWSGERKIPLKRRKLRRGKGGKVGQQKKVLAASDKKGGVSGNKSVWRGERALDRGEKKKSARGEKRRFPMGKNVTKGEREANQKKVWTRGEEGKRWGDRKELKSLMAVGGFEVEGKRKYAKSTALENKIDPAKREKDSPRKNSSGASAPVKKP